MTALYGWLCAGWCAVVLSALISMMAVFMGSTSADLRALLDAQLFAIPLSLVAVAAYLTAAGRQLGSPPLWRAVPGWLIFAALAVNSLVMIAELTFYLIQHLAAEPRPWREHVPAIAALSASLALCCGYATWQRALSRAAARDESAG